MANEVTPCACTAVSEYALNCKPSIGGIASVTIKESTAGATAINIQVLPDTSSFNAVMTYDKTKNLKYWTVDVTLGIGTLDAGARAFIEGDSTHGSIACPVGRIITLTMNSGHTVVISDIFAQTATFNSGAAKTDGSTGQLVFQAITATAPSVTDPA